MAEHAGKPKVRFAGFTEDWEQRKLGEIGTSFDYGLNAAAKPFDGKNRYIRITDIDDNSRSFLQTDLTSPDTNLDQAKSSILQEGDIVFARTGASVGKTYIYNKNDGLVYFAGFLIRVRVKPEYNVDFVFQNTLTKNYAMFINITSQRSGQPGVNAQEYASFTFLTPTLPEQARIGAFFRHLDRLVALHQRKRGRLENIKKAMLEKMFPKNGADVPEVRFAGFTEAWEQRKLVSLCEKFTDGDWIEAKDQSNSGVRLIQTGNVGLGEYIDKQNNKKWISKETFERLNCEEVFSGDILISRLPEPAGRACIVPNLGTKMITAVDCTIVRTATQVNPKYLLQYLSSQSYFDEVNTCLAGGTRQRISRSNLATFDVSMPVKYEEQKAIGEFLCGMDHLITLHQRKVALLQNIKKACLEKMFV